MLINRLQPPVRAALGSLARSGAANNGVAGINEAFAALRLANKTAISQTAVRWSTHKAQGAVNKAKDGPGKRLGAKKSGEQYVIPGNIIFRQRGTHWFPGENCAMGRDHTIYATAAGYVKYYKDPELHAKRQYIGVVFQRDQVLPLPRNSMRRRRLGMEAVKMDTAELEAELEKEKEPVVEEKKAKSKERKGEEGRVLQLKSGYMYRESNWEIGRAAERAGIKVREFKPRDRWTAWRKASIRKAKNSQNRGLRVRGKGKKR